MTQLKAERKKEELSFLNPEYDRRDLIIGIDPGKRGGVAILSTSPERFVKVIRTPLLADGDGGYDYDIMEMYRWVNREIRPYPSVCFVIEKQQAMPQQGVVSMFTTGYGYGLWRMLAAGYPTILIRSMEWQRILRDIDAPDDTKARSIARAQQLFPYIDLCPGKKRTPSDGMADAMNIAHYVFLKMKKKGD